MTETEFTPFNKIPRLRRGIVITEKIDGTNAQIRITNQGEMLVGSRNRWITPDDDNFGFATWVKEHEEELKLLGPGCHFGEWWGPGIQRGYGLAERKFSLFNISRWKEPNVLPACCSLVPVLAMGNFGGHEIDAALEDLRVNGSKASPGFMRPEGIVVFHAAAGSLFKVTLEKDEEPKGK